MKYHFFLRLFKNVKTILKSWAIQAEVWIWPMGYSLPNTDLQDKMIALLLMAVDFLDFMGAPGTLGCLSLSQGWVMW